MNYSIFRRCNPHPKGLPLVKGSSCRGAPQVGRRRDVRGDPRAEAEGDRGRRGDHQLAAARRGLGYFRGGRHGGSVGPEISMHGCSSDSLSCTARAPVMFFYVCREHEGKRYPIYLKVARRAWLLSKF